MEWFWSTTPISSLTCLVKAKFFHVESNSLWCSSDRLGGSAWLNGSWLQAWFRDWSVASSFVLWKGYQVYGVDQGAILSCYLLPLQRDQLWLIPIFLDWCPEVDVLCTAGVLNDYKTAWAKAQRFRKSLRSTMWTPVELTRHIWLNVEKKQGIIINMCSIASSQEEVAVTLYFLHALAGFTKQLASGLCRSWHSSLWHCTRGRQNRHDCSGLKPGGLADWVARWNAHQTLDWARLKLGPLSSKWEGRLPCKGKSWPLMVVGVWSRS